MVAVGKVKVKKAAPPPRPQDALRDPDCERCGLGETADYPCLVGAGPVPSELMIVGEAPGYREDEIGKPFQGKAGAMLDEALEEAGLERDEIYITNAVHCRPPENRTPTQKEVSSCRAILQAEIDLVKPKYVLLLGSTALKSVLNKSGVTKLRGQSIEKDEITYFISIHPAALFRQPQLTPYFKADVQRFALMVKGQLESEDRLKWSLVNTPGKLRECLRSLLAAEAISYDLETSGLDPHDPHAKTYCIGLGQEGKQWVIPLDYPGSPFRDFNTQRKIIASVEKALEGKKLIAHNGKFDNKWLAALYGWSPAQTFDTMLAAYILDENAPHGLKPLSAMYFNAPSYALPQPVNPDEVSLVELCKYNAFDVYYTLRLYKLFKAKLQEDPQLRRIFKHILMPASKALEGVELRGVYIDWVKLGEIRQQLETEIADLLRQLNEVAQKPINWNSVDQVAAFLFGDLGLEVLERTGKGKPSTSGERVLPRLKDKHPAVKLLLDYREKVKLLQFLVGWSKFRRGDCIHPTFQLHRTVTGRLSCKDPNIQQVPRDVSLRSLITAPEGWSFVEADYSQIELRVAAIVSGDTAMRLAYQAGEDIHRKTASAVMGVPPDQVTKDQRKKAKAVNFGFLYGMGAPKFREYARDKYGVDLTDEEAVQFRARFFDLYPGLPLWHDRQRRLVQKFKYVRSPIGRKRRLPEIDSPDRAVRGEAQRQAINSPVQSFASDLALFSLVRITQEFPPEKVRVVGTVHDAVLFTVKSEYLKEVIPRVHAIMTDMEVVERTFKVRVPVPIEVDIKIGPWGSGKEFTAHKEVTS